MRTRWLLCIGIFLTVVGYVIGNLLPVDLLSSTHIGIDITRNEYITRQLAGLSVLATLAATTVALFKEDILALIRSAQLKAKLRDKEVLSEHTVLEQSNDGSPGSSMVATKYVVLPKNWTVS